MRLGRASISLGAVALQAAVLCAQQPADRAALAAWRTRLASDDTTQLAHERAQLQGEVGAAAVAELRVGFVTMYLGQATGNPADLRAALGGFARLVIAQPDWPDAWLGLGLVRLALARRRAPAREGPLQPIGMSYAEGAERALERALALDPNFPEAARALGQAPTIAGSTDPPAASALAALRRAAAGGMSDPGVLLGLARWESAAGQTDSAIHTLERYLAVGDSGVGSYYLARQLFRTGAPAAAAAVASYFRGAQHARSDTVSGLYRQDIAWIATPDELRDYDALAPDARPAWLRGFWGRRDVAEGRPPGARLAEHYRRYEHALAHYRIAPPHTMGRPVLRSGSSRDLSNPIASQASGPVDSMFDRPGLISEPQWSATWGQVFGATGFREYTPTQSVVDDRGVIYLRHGPPDQIAFYVGGPKIPMNVSWKYVRPGADDLIFHFLEGDFDGSAGPSVLVSSLWPEMLPARCGFDAQLCLLGMRQEVTIPGRRGPQRLPPEQIVRQRDRARAAIRLGTTTEEFPRRFKADLEALVQAHGMFGPPATGRLGRLLVVFALPGDRLEPSAIDSGAGGAVYRVGLQIMAFNRRTGQRIDRDTVRLFHSAHVLGPRESLSGLTEVPLPPGPYLASVILSQDGDARGSGIRLDTLTVPTRNDTTPALSDLILGRRGSGLSWQADGMEVPLNPLNAFDRREIVELFYAASGLETGARYRVHLSVTGLKAPDKPLLSLRFEEQASTPAPTFQRELDIRSLRSGHYRLHVVMESVRTGRRAERTAVLNVVER